METVITPPDVYGSGDTRHRLSCLGRRDNAVLLAFLQLLPEAFANHEMKDMWLTFGHHFDYYINNKQPENAVLPHLDIPFPTTSATVSSDINQHGPDAGFILGWSDLYLHHQESATTIRFTHEGELSVSTNSDAFARWLCDIWQNMGITVWVSGVDGWSQAELTGPAFTPAAICASVRRQMEQAGHADCLDLLDIVPDHHWIFLHNRQFAQGGSVYRRRVGKYKYDAIHHPDLLEAVVKLAPLVADNRLPVVKFTNIANVISGEKLVVAYCVKGLAEPHQVKALMCAELGESVYWGSDFFEPK